MPVAVLPPNSTFARNLMRRSMPVHDRAERVPHPPFGYAVGSRSGPCRNRTYNLEIKSLLLCQIELTARRWAILEDPRGSVPTQSAAPDVTAARASSRESWIGKTRSRPVISKIFVMLSSVQTSASEPPAGRSRFTPPTRTPSVVESMNVAFERSTTICFLPDSISSTIRSLNSGAVYRSTSPPSSITWVASSISSSWMWKFTLLLVGRRYAASVRVGNLASLGLRLCPGPLELVRLELDLLPLVLGRQVDGLDRG